MARRRAYPASDRQVNYALRLAGERIADLGNDPKERKDNLQAIFDRIRENDGMLSGWVVSDWIDNLLALPKGLQPGNDQEVALDLTPGIFETNDGIFVVKRSKQTQHLYAKKLVEISGERLNEAAEHVKIDFEYAKGAIFRIKEQDRMPLDERVKQLMIRYGRCIVCGRFLKAATSVERGIGPVCIKAFKH